MSLLELIALLLVAAGGGFWLQGLQVREAALRNVRAVCKSHDLLLLDDTVAFHQFRLERDEQGRLCLQRSYEFEFSDTGNNRCRGFISLRGDQMVLINIGSQ